MTTQTKQINIGDRFQIVSHPNFRVGCLLSGAYGLIEAILPNDQFVLKLDRPNHIVSQGLAVSLGYGEGYAVAPRHNLSQPNMAAD